LLALAGRCYSGTRTKACPAVAAANRAISSLTNAGDQRRVRAWSGFAWVVKGRPKEIESVACGGQPVKSSAQKHWFLFVSLW
jgi:hypothetical protein